MAFLDPTAQYDPEVRPYRAALETFSSLLELGDLGSLPEPKGHLGAIRSVFVSRALREDGVEVLGQILEHAAYLLAGDPYREPELRYNFNLVLLLDVFGLDEEECHLHERALNALIW